MAVALALSSAGCFSACGGCGRSRTPDPQVPENFVSIATVYLTVICYGTLFSQKNEAFQKERLQTMKLLAGSIAHELRTPLSAIGLGVQTLGRLWPFYRDAYAQAVAAQLPVQQLTAVFRWVLVRLQASRLKKLQQ